MARKRGFKKLQIAVLGARTLNPYTPTLRASTIPSKKAQKARTACRGPVSYDER